MMNSGGDTGRSWTPGSLVGDRFRIQGHLGTGGMGQVYRAYDERLRRPVALKRSLSTGATTNDGTILREARRAAGLRDEGIAAVYDALDVDGDTVLVLELVEGEPLRAKMRGPMESARFFDIALQILDAVRVAHAAGVLHGDLKPENVMITPSGAVKVLDFGVARRLVDRGSLSTLSTGGPGTPAYMAPEVHEGKDPDARADLFSIGIVFYELIAGVRPFHAETPSLEIERILRAEPQPLERHVVGLSPGLASLIRRMLAKNAADRPRSAGEVREALANLIGAPAPTPPRIHESRIPAPPVSSALGPTRLGNRSRVVAAIVVVLALTGVAFLRPWRLVGLTHDRPPTPNVAVLPLTSDSGGFRQRDFDAFSVGVASLLNDELQRLAMKPPLQVARFGEVMAVHGESSALASDWGVNLELRTRLHDEGRDFDVLVSLETTNPREVVDAEQTRGPKDIGGLLLSIQEAMVGLLHIPSPREAPWYVREGPGTLRFYVLGLGHRWLAQASDENAAEQSRHFEASLENFATSISTTVALPRGHAAIASLCSVWGRKLAAHDPQLADSLYRRGLEEADLALAGAPDLAEAYHARGEILYRQRLYEDSRAALFQALADEPCDHEAVRRLAGIAVETGHFAEAESLLRARALVMPHLYRYQLELGRVLYEAGHPDDALRAYERAISCLPSFATSWASAGGLLVGLARYTEAERYLSRALHLCKSWDAYSNLGSLYYFERRFNEAAQTYNLAIADGFADHRMWRNLGDALFQIDPGAAAGPYEKSLALSVGLPREAVRDSAVSAERGLLLARLGRRVEAEAVLSRIVTQPTAASIGHGALKDVALGLEACGAHDGAIAALREAVSRGLSVTELRDSPEFEVWRADERFRLLVEARTEATGSAKDH